MKKNKGFTLIELLAVIIVLAIIALIATPIVMNTIKNSKKNSALISGQAYIKQVGTTVMQNRLETGHFIKDGTYTINSDGNLTGNGLEEPFEIPMSGKKPSSGTITIKNGQVEEDSVFIVIDNYEITYDENDSNYIAGEFVDYLINGYSYNCPPDSGCEEEKFYQGPIARNQIEKIEFMTSSKVPSDAIDSWVVSEKGTIKAWYKDEDNNGLYEVYIGQNGGVKANDLEHFFLGLTNLKKADLTNLDTSNVTTMFSMFNGCSSLTSITFGDSFDTSNVTKMESMFNGCSSLTELNLSSFDTSNVTTMFSMFNGCSSLTSLDLSNFDTSKVTDTGFMFFGTTNLITINFDNANFNSVLESWSNVNMFYSSGVTRITVKSEDAKVFIEKQLEYGSINNVTVEVVG